MDNFLSPQENSEDFFRRSPIEEVVQSYSGRPPWYDTKGRLKQPYVVGLCGGSASGKTTVANSIIKRMNVPWVVILSVDSFYNVLTPEQHEAANKMDYDFDHPDAIDSELAVETLKKMKEGKTVRIPMYDFKTHSRLHNKERVVYGANVIIVEGLMAFAYPRLVELMDFKIFIHTDSDLRLSRRILRDMSERDRSLSSILVQYTRFVKPNFDKYISPLSAIGDIIIPWNTYNKSAIGIVSRLIKRNLEDRGFIFRSELLTNSKLTCDVTQHVHLIKQTHVVKYLLTSLRNRLTERQEFLTNSRRLIKLTIIESLHLIQKQPHNETSKTQMICSVSIIRAGEAFEETLKNVLFDYRIGRLIIRTNQETTEPEFHHADLPDDIQNCSVLLFDATIASGAAAMMAIRTLKDHDVKEEDIIMVSLILTPTGVNAIQNAFPQVRFVAAAIDEQVNENYYIIPGMGNFGKRYYGF